MKREDYLGAIKRLEGELANARCALADFDAAAENNIFLTLEDAAGLEDILLERASEDCEGSHNCGLDEYRQEFMCDGKKYVAILDVEYNRHDKRYYYVDGHGFKIKELSA